MTQQEINKMPKKKLVRWALHEAHASTAVNDQQEAMFADLLKRGEAGLMTQGINDLKISLIDIFDIPDTEPEPPIEDIKPITIQFDETSNKQNQKSAKSEKPKDKPKESRAKEPPKDESKSKLNLFPTVITNAKLKELGIDVLIRVDDVSIEDVVNREKPMFTSVYWTPEDIKKYKYFENTNRPVCLNAFQDDLDIQEIVFHTRRSDMAHTNFYATSVFTGIFSTYFSEVLKQKADGVYVNDGAEFMIYIGEIDKQDDQTQQEEAKQVEL
jgi:hypothetical protein